MSTDNKSSTTSLRVLKALSIFGGVQVFVIVCSIIRNKCVALWLGTAGIGVFALYNYTLELINQIVQLNIRQSGVRDISSSPLSMRERTVAIVRCVSGWLGIIGAMLTLLLSPLLSYWTFGDYSHTWGFAALAISVGLSALTSGEQAILQATDRLRLLARTSVIGASGGTVASIIMFRYMGMKSIVPSIIIFVVISALCSIYFSRKAVKSPRVGTKTAFTSAKPMVKLGLYMTVSMALGSLVSYIFISWLRIKAGEQGVGIYQAGYVIINQYVGLIFVALGVEYFPRMSRVADSNRRTSIFMRHELVLLMCVMLPCVVVFINAAPLIVNLLYSSDFEAIVPYISIAATGTVLKAISFVMAYVILARGDGKIYLVTESVSSLLFIALSVGGYRLGGLVGVAYGYVAWYALYTLSVWIVCHFRYNLRDLGGYLFLALSVVIIAGIQSATCLAGHYIPAIAISVIATIVSSLLLYRRVLKRRTEKE